MSETKAGGRPNITEGSEAEVGAGQGKGVTIDGEGLDRGLLPQTEADDEELTPQNLCHLDQAGN